MDEVKPFVFKPAPAVPVDKVLEGLKKLGIEEEDEVKKVKDLLKSLKESKKDGKAPIKLDIFKQFAGLKLCKPTDENLKNSMNVALINREVKENKQHV